MGGLGNPAALEQEACRMLQFYVNVMKYDEKSAAWWHLRSKD
jgi:hypothetical protein